ncbi:glutathione s-transferase zeta 1 [Plakobranchus ocellatus]|uniref:Glutathione s-transferase zeta 1 n=1 Tax=Plakobranchus ocellatus TaxID=259542 RepID=A0AAV4DXT2_9GAST|nr:glutathione s-transferase zeta 1 [Plakobranchus ocellatus]
MYSLQVRALAEIVNSAIQPLQNSKVLQKVGEGKEEWARFFIERGLKGFEKMLETTAGTYCYGDQVTMADLCLVPQIYNASNR